METSALLLLFSSSLLLLLLTPTSSSRPTCSPSSCHHLGPKVRFPFRLNTQPNTGCSYPGFDILSCNNQNQTILTLPNTEPYVVNQIDYANQWIYINDPGFCLSKRLLNFTLSGSPFAAIYTRPFTFVNCSWSRYMYYYGSEAIYCLSVKRNYTVIAAPPDFYMPSNCRFIKTVSVPVQDLYLNSISMDFNEDLQLKWNVPGCGECEARGGTCGFTKGDKIVCFNLPAGRGLPRSTKYGTIIGVGILGLVCFIGLLCYTCSKVRSNGTPAGRHLDADLSNPTVTSQQAVAMVGLDRPTIESYPKTVLGESRQLPNPNDGTCPICLAEYQPKETLRTIPECNHYFHANCIDEWLIMNATCPMCRKTPDGSSVVTPC